RRFRVSGSWFLEALSACSMEQNQKIENSTRNLTTNQEPENRPAGFHSSESRHIRPSFAEPDLLAKPPLSYTPTRRLESKRTCGRDFLAFGSRPLRRAITLRVSRNIESV